MQKVMDSTLFYISDDGFSVTLIFSRFLVRVPILIFPYQVLKCLTTLVCFKIVSLGAVSLTLVQFLRHANHHFNRFPTFWKLKFRPPCLNRDFVS